MRERGDNQPGTKPEVAVDEEKHDEYDRRNIMCSFEEFIEPIPIFA